MTKNEIEKLDDHTERITRVETKIDNVERKIDKLDEKFDLAIACKADKDEVAKNDKAISDRVKILDSRFWQILVGVFMAMVTALIGLIISIKKG